MREISEYPDLGIRVFRSCQIPMSDGVTLSADLYMPFDAELDGTNGRFPCVLEYKPYRKDTIGTPDPNHWYGYFPRNGYVMALVECRGTGGSAGISTDEYREREQLDGCAAVEWLGTQPWCSGHVNMIGISYGGFTSVQIAARAPKHLSSIIPIDFTDNRYTDDVHYTGGLLRMWCDPGYYSGFMVPYNALPPALWNNSGDWADLWESHLEKNQPWLLEWLRHQTDGPYWRNGSVGAIADRIKCPVFMIGGWWDAYPAPALRLTQALKSPWKLLIGPWDHETPDVGIPGPTIDYLPIVLRWLDRWCRGAAAVDEPNVHVYMQRFDQPVVDLLVKSGEWRSENSWPPAGAGTQSRYFAPKGMLADGTGSDGCETLRYDARVGVTRGLVQGGQPLVMPIDQRPDESLSVLFTSEPLEADLPILGTPQVTLYTSSTAKIMPYIVCLTEVAADGTSVLVSKGRLNATRRDSLVEPSPIVPNELMELKIDLLPTGWIFTKGNRIRVAIANADFPETWPTPEPGSTSIFYGSERSSRIDLPVVSMTGSAPPPDFAPSPVDSRVRLVGDRKWEVVDNLISGARSVRLAWSLDRGVGDPTSQRVSLDVTCTVDPKDPAQASVVAHTGVLANFGSIAVEARGRIVIQGTATHFHVVIGLELLVCGSSHATRRWVETIPRSLL